MKDTRALSYDGYIIDQRYTGEFQYGCYKSSLNGCGWIAAYNMLRYLGFEDTPEDIAAGMNAVLPYHGRHGTPVATLKKYLVSRGVAVRRVGRGRYVPRTLSRCRAGIIRYLDEGVPHYASFGACGGDKFRFCNAVEGDAAHISTMDEFFRAHVGLFFTCALVAADERGGEKA